MSVIAFLCGALVGIAVLIAVICILAAAKIMKEGKEKEIKLNERMVELGMMTPDEARELEDKW